MSEVQPDWQNLYRDVLEHLFSFLSFKELLACGITCKHWNGVSNLKRIWRTLYIENREENRLPVITEESIHFTREEIWCWNYQNGRECKNPNHFDSTEKRKIKRFPRDPKRAYLDLKLTEMTRTTCNYPKHIRNLNYKISGLQSQLDYYTEKRKDLEEDYKVIAKAQEMRAKRKLEIQTAKQEKEARKAKRRKEKEQRDKFKLAKIDESKIDESKIE